MSGLNGNTPDDISRRLIAAQQGEQWGPHPLIRRMANSKGEERLQQLWVANTGKMDFRDIPLFNLKGEYVNEGDSAINTGPIAGATSAPAGELSKVPSES